MKMRKTSIAWLVFLGIVVAWLMIGVWKSPMLVPVIRQGGGPQYEDSEPLLGTCYRMIAVVPSGQTERGRDALGRAVETVRQIDRLMTTYEGAEPSDVRRLNAAEAETPVPLDPRTREVLARARQLHERTGGAFDVTVHPIVRLWREAKKRGRPPTDAELHEARQASRWEHIKLRDGGAVKSRATAAVNLGGIAKGYAIDQAVAVLRAAGVQGGLVDIGGDVRCFGRREREENWRIGIRNPFYAEEKKGRNDTIATVETEGAAVCTSGNYERAREIDGARYSHIIDPEDPGLARTRALAGQVAASVTVIAPEATTADAWATALSVLGPEEGIRMIESPENDGIEAMFIVGEPGDYEMRKTSGFGQYLAEESGARE